MRQPSVESAEEARKLRTRLQESDKRLQEAEQLIDELETKKESWRQEVGGDNRPYSYSRYWTGTSLQWRLMRGNVILKGASCDLLLKRLPALASIGS